METGERSCSHWLDLNDLHLALAKQYAVTMDAGLGDLLTERPGRSSNTPAMTTTPSSPSNPVAGDAVWARIRTTPPRPITLTADRIET